MKLLNYVKNGKIYFLAKIVKPLLFVNLSLNHQQQVLHLDEVLLQPKLFLQKLQHT